MYFEMFKNFGNHVFSISNSKYIQTINNYVINQEKILLSKKIDKFSKIYELIKPNIGIVFYRQ